MRESVVERGCESCVEGTTHCTTTPHTAPRAAPHIAPHPTPHTAKYARHTLHHTPHQTHSRYFFQCCPRSCTARARPRAWRVHSLSHTPIHINTQGGVYTHPHTHTHTDSSWRRLNRERGDGEGGAASGRLLKLLCLFCERALFWCALLQRAT